MHAVRARLVRTLTHEKRNSTVRRLIKYTWNDYFFVAFLAVKCKSGLAGESSLRKPLAPSGRKMQVKA